MAQKQNLNRPRSDHGEYEKKANGDNLAVPVSGDASQQLKMTFEGNSLELVFNAGGKGVAASIVYDEHNVFTLEGGHHHDVSNIEQHSENHSPKSSMKKGEVFE